MNLKQIELHVYSLCLCVCVFLKSGLFNVHYLINILPRPGKDLYLYSFKLQSNLPTMLKEDHRENGSLGAGGP